MHGASIAALNMYDMLKPIDKHIEIRSIKLLSKKGGKSSMGYNGKGKTAIILVCSDRVFSSKAEDISGIILEKLLRLDGVKVLVKEVVPDEVPTIQESIIKQLNKQISS